MDGEKGVQNASDHQQPRKSIGGKQLVGTHSTATAFNDEDLKSLILKLDPSISQEDAAKMNASLRKESEEDITPAELVVRVFDRMTNTKSLKGSTYTTPQRKVNIASTVADSQIAKEQAIMTLQSRFEWTSRALRASRAEKNSLEERLASERSAHTRCRKELDEAKEQHHAAKQALSDEKEKRKRRVSDHSSSSRISDSSYYLTTSKRSSTNGRATSSDGNIMTMAGKAVTQLKVRRLERAVSVLRKQLAEAKEAKTKEGERVRSHMTTAHSRERVALRDALQISQALAGQLHDKALQPVKIMLRHLNAVKEISHQAADQQEIACKENKKASIARDAAESKKKRAEIALRKLKGQFEEAMENDELNGKEQLQAMARLGVLRNRLAMARDSLKTFRFSASLTAKQEELSNAHMERARELVTAAEETLLSWSRERNRRGGGTREIIFQLKNASDSLRVKLRCYDTALNEARRRVKDLESERALVAQQRDRIKADAQGTMREIRRIHDEEVKSALLARQASERTLEANARREVAELHRRHASQLAAAESIRNEERRMLEVEMHRTQADFEAKLAADDLSALRDDEHKSALRQLSRKLADVEERADAQQRGLQAKHERATVSLVDSNNVREDAMRRKHAGEKKDLMVLYEKQIEALAATTKSEVARVVEEGRVREESLREMIRVERKKHAEENNELRRVRAEAEEKLIADREAALKTARRKHEAELAQVEAQEAEARGKLTSELSLIRNDHTKELQTVRESHSNHLRSVRRKLDEEVKKLEKAHRDAEQQLQLEAEARLIDQKATFDAKLLAISKERDAARRAVEEEETRREKDAKEAREARRKQAAEYAALEKEREEQHRKQIRRLEKERLELEELHEEALKESRNLHRVAESKVEDDFNGRVDALHALHRKQLEARRKSSDTQREALYKELEEEKKKHVKILRESRLEASEERMQAVADVRSEMKKVFAHELEAAAAAHTAEIARLKTGHSRTIEELASQFEGRLQASEERAKAQVKSAMRAAEEKHTAEVAELRAEHDNLREKLEARVALAERGREQIAEARRDEAAEHKASLQRAEKAHADALEKLSAHAKAEQKAALEELAVTSAAAREATQIEHRRKLIDVEREHTEQLETAERAHAAALEASEKRLKEAVRAERQLLEEAARLQASEEKRVIDTLKATHDEMLRSIRRRHAQELKDAEKAHFEQGRAEQRKSVQSIETSQKQTLNQYKRLLEELKRAHAAETQRREAEHKAALESSRRENAENLAKLQSAAAEVTGRTTAEQQESLTRALKRLSSAHEEELKRVEAANQIKSEQLTQKLRDALETHENALIVKEESHAKALQTHVTMVEESKAALAVKEENHAAELKLKVEEHSKALTEAQREHARELEKTREQAERALSDHREQLAGHLSAVENLKAAHELKVKSLEAQHEAGLEQMASKHVAEKELRESMHNAKLSEQACQHEEQQNGLKQQVARLTAELEHERNTSKERGEALAALKASLSDKLKQQQGKEDESTSNQKQIEAAGNKGLQQQEEKGKSASQSSISLSESSSLAELQRELENSKKRESTLLNEIATAREDLELMNRAQKATEERRNFETDALARRLANLTAAKNEGGGVGGSESKDNNGSNGSQKKISEAEAERDLSVIMHLYLDARDKLKGLAEVRKDGYSEARKSKEALDKALAENRETTAALERAREALQTVLSPSNSFRVHNKRANSLSEILDATGDVEEEKERSVTPLFPMTLERLDSLVSALCTDKAAIAAVAEATVLSKDSDLMSPESIRSEIMFGKAKDSEGVSNKSKNIKSLKFGSKVWVFACGKWNEGVISNPIGGTKQPAPVDQMERQLHQVVVNIDPEKKEDGKHGEGKSMYVFDENSLMLEPWSKTEPRFTPRVSISSLLKRGGGGGDGDVTNGTIADIGVVARFVSGEKCLMRRGES
eukprot:jgi/Bigna1/135849/aug1.31_g10557